MHAVKMFAREGMLMHRGSNWFVINRVPMRNCAAFKNCYQPFQVLNSDQSEYKLFRSLRKAIRWCDARNYCNEA